MKTYDYLIIGFGKAGKTLAAKLAKTSRVVLVEKDDAMYGGTCINVGCIPSKRLAIESLKAKDAIDKKDFYKKTIEEKIKLTSALNKANYDKLIGAGVDVILGHASFIDSTSVQVTGLNTKEIIKADKIIINTGSSSFIPNIKGIDNKKVYTSKSLMDLDELPDRLTIIGGGYIGLEFASMYANFGSKVTIVQVEDEFLGREDEDVSSTIEEILKNKNINIIKSAKLEEIDGADLKYSLEEKNFTLKGDAILVATGRKPNIEGLKPENAGIKLTERGAVETNENLLTSVNNIYAAGDVCGRQQFTYISLDDSRIILSSLNNKERTINNRGAFSYSVFIDPAFSRVGLSEKEAQANNIKYRLVKLPTAMIPKAKILKKTEGFLKALISEDGQILGAALICEESYEMINIIKMAMDNKLPYTYLRDFIFTHPTMSESLNDLFSL